MWNNISNLITLKYIKVLGSILVEVNNTQKPIQSKVSTAIENKLLEYVGKLQSKKV